MDQAIEHMRSMQETLGLIPGTACQPPTPNTSWNDFGVPLNIILSSLPSTDRCGSTTVIDNSNGWEFQKPLR